MSFKDELMTEGELSMENELIQDEFTFKKVWALLKASLVRIVIFCLIAAITMGIVSAVVLTTTRKTRELVSATITYAHEGIENGKAPDGTNLNVGRIKSPQIVKLAIEEYNKTAADKIDINDLTAIVENIEVKGHIPSNILSQIEFQMSLGDKADNTVLKQLLDVFPSQYTLSIANLGEAKLSVKQSIALIDEILRQYIADFKKVYGSPSLLENLSAPILNKDNDVMSFEFVELHSIYEENIKKAINYLNTHSSQNPLFRSQETGKTFKDIALELESLQSNRLFQLETFILQNSLTNDIDYTMEYLLTIRRQYVQRQKDASDNAKAVGDMIKAYLLGDIIIGVGPNGESVIGQGGPTETYDNLFRLQQTYASQAVSYGSSVATVDQRLEYFAELVGEDWVVKASAKNTEERRTKAKEMSAALADEINTLFQLANDTATDFYDVEYMKNAVNITLPAAHLTESSSLFRLMLIISAAVVFLTFIGAIVTTHVVLANKKLKLEREIDAETK